MKVLWISPDFNYSCGVSKHVTISLKNLARDPDYKLFFITNKGDSLERLKDIPGLNTEIMNFEKDHKNIFRMLADFYKLYSFCIKNKIDLIHTHHRYPELISVLVSKFTGIKTITTVHSFVKGLKYISFKSDKIISVSEAVGQYLQKSYLRGKRKSMTLYNCVDNSFYDDTNANVSDLRKSFGYSDDDKIILFAGRICKMKGSDILIEAFNRLPDNLKAKLLMIGSVTDSYLHSFLEKENDKINLIESQKDIIPYYRISDVIVLPSLEDPFPYVMLEAGVMKKPFIGGETGGIREFIDDNVNGFLVKPGSIEALLQKIKYVFNNDQIAANAGQRLFEKVKSTNGCEQYFSSLKNIYNELVRK